MDAGQLLKALQRDAIHIAATSPAIFERLDKVCEGPDNNPSTSVAVYDYAVFRELLAASATASGTSVDEVRLADFRELIDRYMDTYAPGNEGLKTYVRTVSTYLAFIARRPLHPPGMKFSGGRSIESRGGYWHCPGKKEQITAPGSLCKYCVCRGD